MDGKSYEDGPDYVKGYIRTMFVDEWAYDERDDMICRFSTDPRIEVCMKAWDIMDGHEEDYTNRYRAWVEANTGDDGIGYQKPIGRCEYGRGCLWYEFLTDYGTRHANDIVEICKEEIE